MEPQARQTTKAHWLTVYQTYRVHGVTAALEDTDYESTQVDLLDFFNNLHPWVDVVTNAPIMSVRKLP